jgi:hypothetical protein
MKRYNKFISVSFIKLLDAKFNIEAKGWRYIHYN